MNAELTVAVVGGSLLLALWTALSAVREKGVNRLQLVGVALVELLVLAMAVVALIAMSRDEGPVGETVTFLGYLATIALILPAAWLWARSDSSKWGSWVVTVVALVLPVLVVRLGQVWTGEGPTPPGAAG